MNDQEGLIPDDHAIRLFFSKDTIYPEKVSSEATISIPSGQIMPEKKATLAVDGSVGADLIMVFSHDGADTLKAGWTDMISGLIGNPNALNRDQDTVLRINLRNNPSLRSASDFGQFPGVKVIVWGNSGIPEFDRLEPYARLDYSGKQYLKVEHPDLYVDNRNKKGELWQHIKAFLS